MIKAIMLDFGGVYMDSPFVAINHIAKAHGIDAQLLSRIIFGDYEKDSQHPWHRLERGEISLETARLLIIEEGLRYQLDTDIYSLLAQFAEVPRGLNQALVNKTLQWQQQGIKLALITNNIREFDHWPQLFPFDIHSVFTTISDSCYLGIRKPNPAIYQHTLAALGVAANEALFLDDYLGNVQAARDLAIESFLVQESIDEAIGWIDQHLAQ